MNNMFPDKIWNYKNFNMVTELDISGEFIYDGIRTLNQMKSVDESALLFSFLYHVSVGLERLQKILLVIFEEVTLENYEEFERSLITHSHSGLNDRILKKTDLHLNSRENSFLQLLTTFYKTARYHRFNLKTQYDQETELITDFINNHLSTEKMQTHFITGKVLISEDVKQLFGRIIGSISQKYYNTVREGCHKSNLFSYELRYGSKAESVFLSASRKDSLQERIMTESIVLKELLIFLRNTKQSNALIRFIESIPPLELDPGCLNEYIENLTIGTVSQSLIDEIECLYEENVYSKDRIDSVDLIGDSNVLFDFREIDDCLQMLNRFADGNVADKEFALQFPQKLEMVDDDCAHEILDDVVKLCSQFLCGEMTHKDFVEAVYIYNIDAKKFFN